MIAIAAPTMKNAEEPDMPRCVICMLVTYCAPKR